ncbi:MAG: Spy/CpxP family protein refolding chaperone [Betaproteobacteria bacterium]|nr:Spy/CpxP family protein refolding chaperone [Betaproteobacteria bacterium]
MRRKLIEVIGTMAFAALVSSSAFAQMGGGGMMGGFGGGMMGRGMMGGYGMGPGDGYRYGPDARADRGDAAATPRADRRRETSIEAEPDPIDQLELSNKQLGAINGIRAGLKDRQSNLNRRLELEQEKLRKLYDAPQRDRPRIDAQFRRIEELRREMFESSIDANERIEAQLSAEQRQRLHRIAPRWKVSG